MSEIKCPVYSWCDVDNDTDHIAEGWHREEGVADVAPGYLRTDHVLNLEEGLVSLDISDSIAWIVDADESQEFFQTLRAAIDTAEAKFEAFKSRVAGEVTDHA